MGDFDAIHCAVPCETWSIARDEELVCRTRTNPLGMDGLPRNLAEKVIMHNALLVLSLDMCRLVVCKGGEATIENPADRGNELIPQT